MKAQLLQPLHGKPPLVQPLIYNTVLIERRMKNHSQAFPDTQRLTHIIKEDNG